MLSFFLSVWKETEHVLFEGGIQVGQAGNGGVGAQKGGKPGREDREHRKSRRRPGVRVTGGQSAWRPPQEGRREKSVESCQLLQGPTSVH